MPGDLRPISNRQDRHGDSAPSPKRAVAVNGHTSLGHYDLQREVGRGGMGTVYEAWDRSLERSVALKVLHQHISASRASIERFQREARAVARLRHMNITPIYSQDEEDGIYYYVMEFVEGENLNEIIGEARDHQIGATTTIALDETVPLPRATGAQGESVAAKSAPAADPASSGATTVTTIHRKDEEMTFIARHVASIADALSYAHMAGVIHRDIKPHNLILDSNGEMRVTDFGLARVAQQPGVTATGEVLGSPLYMSPEQIFGAPGGVDHRSDIYSLGATMYEWLTLSPPYPGETREQVISRLANAEPLLLRTRCPNIPVDLETICLKAIERDPARRYQTADEFAEDLRRYLLKKPIKASRPGAWTRMRRYIERHPIAGLLAIAVPITVILAWSLRTKSGEVKTTQAQLDQVSAVVEEEKALNDRLLDAFGSILPPEVGSIVSGAEAAAPMVQGIMDSVATEPGANLAAAGTPEGIARRATRDLYNEVADLPSPGGSDVSEDDKGLLELAKSKWNGGQKAEEEALTLLRFFLRTYPNHFEAHQLRAAIYGSLGDFQRMLIDVSVLTQHYSSNPVAHIWCCLGYLMAGDAEKAQEQVTQAENTNGSALWVRALRALALIQIGRSPEAAASLADMPEFVIGILVRATAKAASADTAGAVADLTRVVELEPTNADVLVARGQYQGVLGDFAAAAADFERAMDIAGRTPELNLLWALATMQHRRSENTAPAGEPTDGQEVPADDEATEATNERLQEWFSKFVYPRTIDATDRNSSAPTLTPQPRLGPHEPQ